MTKPLVQKTLFDWYSEKEEKEQSRASFEVIDFLANKPLSEPRVMQTFLCRWCFNPVTQVPKQWGEYVHLRAVVMLPDSLPDPPICNGCYDSVVSSFNRQVTVIGTNNAGYNNLALAKL